MDSSARPVALVTGASGGIGAALARELARHGHDLVLAARDAAAMEALAAELREGGAGTTVIPADLSKPGAAATLADEIARGGVAIDILVNNAGLGAAGRFDHNDPARIGEILQVNIVALTELTRLLLPAMQARRLGGVINVASTAAFQPLPYIAVYGASKAYVLHLTEALAAEYEGSGVRFLALCPGNTRTRFTEVANADVSGMAAATPESVVAAALQALATRRHYLVPGWLNYLTAQLPRLLSRRQVTRLVATLFAKRIMPKVS